MNNGSINKKPPQMSRVTDQVLRHLADLAEVPPDNRGFFFDSVRENVTTACELDGLKNVLAHKRSEKLVESALSFYDTLANLNDRERRLIDDVLRKGRSIFGKLSAGGVDGLHKTAYGIASLFCLVTGKRPPRYPSEPPESPGSGRRKGTVKNWIFQNFVYDLIISTTTADGRLTLEKNIPSGSLVEAIKILAPYLPPDIVPPKPPGSTLQRLKDTASRAVKAIHELDQELSDDTF